MKGRGARGGKGGVEPRLRIRAREQRTLDLHLSGHSQHEIARELDVSQAAVSKILKRIEGRFANEIAASFKHLRARQLFRLEHLYAESLKAWRRSVTTDNVRRRQRKTEAATGGGQLVELVSENSHGDARYLDVARRILADQREVLGLNAPTTLAVDLTASLRNLSQAELTARLTKQETLLKQLEAESRPTTPTTIDVVPPENTR